MENWKFLLDLLAHHFRVFAGLDGVEVDPVAVAVLAAHEEHGLHAAIVATAGTPPHLSDCCREPLALHRAVGAVVEVAVHVGDPVGHGDPNLRKSERGFGDRCPSYVENIGVLPYTRVWTTHSLSVGKTFLGSMLWRMTRVAAVEPPYHEQ